MLYKAWIFLENHEVHFRVPVGSIEGPGQILDPIRINSRLPRVPWYGFCSLTLLATGVQTNDKPRGGVFRTPRLFFSFFEHNSGHMKPFLYTKQLKGLISDHAM